MLPPMMYKSFSFLGILESILTARAKFVSGPRATMETFMRIRDSQLQEDKHVFQVYYYYLLIMVSFPHLPWMLIHQSDQRMNCMLFLYLCLPFVCVSVRQNVSQAICPEMITEWFYCSNQTAFCPSKDRNLKTGMILVNKRSMCHGTPQASLFLCMPQVPELFHQTNIYLSLVHLVI